MKLKMFLLMLMQVFPLKIAEAEISETEKNNELVILKNKFTETGILTNAGGRIVIFKRNEGTNILKSDSQYWDYSPQSPLEDCLDMTIVPLNGHITWLGPQSKWWLDQDVNLALKKQKSLWPPDPYLIYAICEIIHQTENSVILRNPDSPLTGVSLTKKISLFENGDIEIISEIENIRDTTISWDIWFNTRLDGRSRFYVPTKNIENIRVEKSANNICQIKEKIINDYFTFSLCERNELNEITASKAFIHPTDNKIYAFSGNNLFIIQFDLLEKGLIHNEQAVVEVFNRIKPDGDDLLELEHHGPFTELKPRQKTSLKEVWSLIEYPGENNIKSQLDFINSLKYQ